LRHFPSGFGLAASHTASDSARPVFFGRARSPAARLVERARVRAAAAMAAKKAARSGAAGS